MGNGTNPDYGDDFAAALGWWREAGVDVAFLDSPRSWLPVADAVAEPSAQRGRQAQPVEHAPAEPPAPTLPDTLDAFGSWWLEAPELDHGRVSGRVAPRGSPTPELMVLAPMPESGDREQLLSGPEGRLLSAFARAAGIGEDAIYWASALPCHSPGADWSPDGNRAIAQTLIRHIALVRPQRVLTLGFIILPLLGHASPQGPAVSLNFNHEGATIPMLAVRRIPAQAAQARWKSALWRTWLDWTA